MIELKGIIQYRDAGHIYTEIVVTRVHPDIYENHRVGTDVKLDRALIEAKLTGLFDKAQGPAKWPHHIKTEEITGVPAHGPVTDI